MANKTEAQPEALRLAEAQRYSDVVHHANVKASLAYVARKTGLGYQETERLLELALKRGDLAEGDYSGRKIENTTDDRLASLEAQLVTQTNRAAAAEQQVTALTQRLDTANTLNTEARNQLAQLSARQAMVPDGFVSIYDSSARGIFAQTPTKMHGGPERNWRPVAFIDAETDALVAAPPPPEREPPRYRLLARGEAMQVGDEFIDDDCETWHPIQAGFVRAGAVWSSVWQPMRRRISAAPKQEGST